MTHLEHEWKRAAAMQRERNRDITFTSTSDSSDTFYVLDTRNRRWVSKGGVVTAVDKQAAFAPIAAGSYGCVFMPRLLTLGEDVDTPRGTELISKLMTLGNASKEWEEQKNIKDRLITTGVAVDGDNRYIFGVGSGPMKVGEMSPSDMKHAESVCSNFKNRLTMENLKDAKWLNRKVRKIDQPNGGVSLRGALKNAGGDTNSVFLKMMDIYAMDGGLIDNIVAMNTSGVFHGDIKPDNLTISSDTNTISIIDWGLASMEERDVDDLGCAFWEGMEPMNTWMFNIPTTNIAYTEEVFDLFDNNNIITPALMWDAMFEFVVGAYEKGNPSSHLDMIIAYVATYRKLRPDWIPEKELWKNYNTTQARRVGGLGISMRSTMFFVAILTRRMLVVMDLSNGLVGELYFNEVYKYNVDIWGALTVLQPVFGQIDYAMVDKEAYADLFQYIFIDGGDRTPYDIDKVKKMIRKLRV